MSKSEPAVQKYFLCLHSTGDGNCLFRSISRYLFGSEVQHLKLRLEAVAYIKKRWDYFKPFILEECGNLEIDTYVKKMTEDGSYGSSVECLALSDLYKINIHIFRSSLPTKNRFDFNYPDSDKITISSKNHEENLYLVFSGHALCGHFDLLMPTRPPSGSQTSCKGNECDSSNSTEDSSCYSDYAKSLTQSDINSTKVSFPNVSERDDDKSSGIISIKYEKHIPEANIVSQNSSNFTDEADVLDDKFKYLKYLDEYTQVSLEDWSPGRIKSTEEVHDAFDAFLFIKSQLLENIDYSNRCRTFQLFVRRIISHLTWLPLCCAFFFLNRYLERKKKNT